MDLKLCSNEIPVQSFYLKISPKILQKSLVFRAPLVPESFSIRLETMTMCFEINVFNNLDNNVCEYVYS